MNVPFTEFLRRIGAASIKDFFQQLLGSLFAFALIYGFAFLFMLPFNWAGKQVIQVSGIPERYFSYAIGVGFFIYAIYKRRSTFDALEKFFRKMKEVQGWLVVSSACIIGAVLWAGKYLPEWAGLALWIGSGAIFQFIEKLADLGSRYFPPEPDFTEILAVDWIEGILPKTELELRLRTFLTIAHKSVPPEHSWQEQASEMRDAIIGLVQDIRHSEKMSASTSD